MTIKPWWHRQKKTHGLISSESAMSLVEVLLVAAFAVILLSGCASPPPIPTVVLPTVPKHLMAPAKGSWLLTADYYPPSPETAPSTLSLFPNGKSGPQETNSR